MNRACRGGSDLLWEVVSLETGWHCREIREIVESELKEWKERVDGQ